MGSGFSKMKKQAKMLEGKFQAMQAEKAKKEVSGSAGNGLVSIIMSGDNKMKKITISKECLADVEGLQDLIIAAYHNALEKIEADDDSSKLLKPFGF
ncbi:MAG TPA: YbaB/EbfC family nucleoid-associated protein [Chlamydiales bacterium]|nr:YbaB/EbfC family nucleoid-associated protein [Chlamydiales bacterium]